MPLRPSPNHAIMTITKIMPLRPLPNPAIMTCQNSAIMIIAKSCYYDHCQIPLSRPSPNTLQNIAVTTIVKYYYRCIVTITKSCYCNQRQIPLLHSSQDKCWKGVVVSVALTINTVGSFWESAKISASTSSNSIVRANLLSCFKLCHVSS